PAPGGTLALDGEPTAVTLVGDTAFVGLNTSESYVDPSGELLAVSMSGRQVVARCPLPGQPDSLASAPDRSLVAIAIENERDEDLNDGAIPQLPAGAVVIAPLADGALDCNALITADVTGLAEVAPSDPEPEFVDVNAEGEIVVTLQENNHIVVLSPNGAVLSHFSAGSEDLSGIDTGEEGAFDFTAEQPGRLREPDAVGWIDDDHFATADEGDYEGGSRGWTIFNQDGTVVYADATRFERALILAGHYPEERSGNKGVEPESIEVASFDGVPHVFVGSERGSIIGVYALDGLTPTLTQLLPSGIGPEGIKALPERGLLITANEVDLREENGPGAHVMIYQLQDGPAAYPTITSEEAIGWNAISGMVADESEPGVLYAVNDSFMGLQPRIFRVEVQADGKGLITAHVDVNREGVPAQKLDLEGIATDGNGGFFLASEGRSDRLIPHALYNVDENGTIQDEIAFPPELLAVERRFGAEGIARDGDTLWIAIQREWADDPDHHAKLVSYNLESEAWGVVHYPKAAPGKGWVGLSEITIQGDHAYIVERDNQIAGEAVTKKIFRVSLDQMQPVPLDAETIPVVEKELVRDLLPDLMQWNGYVQDKVEGFAIDAAGTGYVSTDNDGVDDHSGETHFWSIQID
ncbi:MAG: esterase-like activity of phytase family protein, partial [Pseudomonadota bacterium]